LVIAAIVIAGWVIAMVILLRVMQAALAFPAPPPAAQLPDAGKQAGGETVWLDVHGKRVEAWFLPARHSGRAPLIINAHGNGELIDFWANQVGPLRDGGVGVLLVEYPGYGRSEGKPSQQSITDAMLAAYDWAARNPRVDAQRIVAHGRSMGGGAVGQLLRQRQLAALVLESTYTSLADMVRAHHVPDFLILNRLDTRAALADYRGPVLILHGTRDLNIPFSHAKLLAAAAPQARLVELDCGHNDCPPQWELVLGFLAENGVTTDASVSLTTSPQGAKP
jgi:fermentation-respiration switch protein FrsA (DUF1100 family)